jgi:hypothetical protein
MVGLVMVLISTGRVGILLTIPLSISKAKNQKDICPSLSLLKNISAFLW